MFLVFNLFEIICIKIIYNLIQFLNAFRENEKAYNFSFVGQEPVPMKTLTCYALTIGGFMQLISRKS